MTCITTKSQNTQVKEEAVFPFTGIATKSEISMIGVLPENSTDPERVGTVNCVGYCDQEILDKSPTTAEEIQGLFKAIQDNWHYFPQIAWNSLAFAEFRQKIEQEISNAEKKPVADPQVQALAYERFLNGDPHDKKDAGFAMCFYCPRRTDNLEVGKEESFDKFPGEVIRLKMKIFRQNDPGASGLSLANYQESNKRKANPLSATESNKGQTELNWKDATKVLCRRVYNQSNRPRNPETPEEVWKIINDVSGKHTLTKIHYYDAARDKEMLEPYVITPQGKRIPLVQDPCYPTITRGSILRTLVTLGFYHVFGHYGMKFKIKNWADGALRITFLRYVLPGVVNSDPVMYDKEARNFVGADVLEKEKKEEEERLKKEKEEAEAEEERKKKEKEKALNDGQRRHHSEIDEYEESMRLVEKRARALNEQDHARVEEMPADPQKGLEELVNNFHARMYNPTPRRSTSMSPPPPPQEYSSSSSSSSSSFKPILRYDFPPEGEGSMSNEAPNYAGRELVPQYSPDSANRKRSREPQMPEDWRLSATSPGRPKNSYPSYVPQRKQ